MTACPLRPSGVGGSAAHFEALESKPLPIIQTWLQKGEKITMLSIDKSCAGTATGYLDTLQAGCVSVHTSFGRTVQLQMGTGQKLVPAEEMFPTENTPQGRDAHLHCIGGDYLYLVSQAASPSLWRVKVPIEYSGPLMLGE